MDVTVRKDSVDKGWGRDCCLTVMECESFLVSVNFLGLLNPVYHCDFCSDLNCDSFSQHLVFQQKVKIVCMMYVYFSLLSLLLHVTHFPSMYDILYVWYLT